MEIKAEDYFSRLSLNKVAGNAPDEINTAPQ